MAHVDNPQSKVWVERCRAYDLAAIDEIIQRWESLFQTTIRPGDRVVLKPNWIAHAHKFNEHEWQSVITHPTVITSVLKLTLACLQGRGSVLIVDGPQTDSSWRKIMQRMTPDAWMALGQQAGVNVSILDLREDEWVTEKDVNVGRKKLAGDPLGATECDLRERSEFVGHCPTRHGYYGADYNKQETAAAHANGHHQYKVSRSVIAADVFINLPKMKTHKKAGITCSLKNLVGINTYKNWLPHHTEGTPDEGGDQFPDNTVKNKAEIVLLEAFKSYLHRHQHMGKRLIPLKSLGKKLFGDTQHVIRSGNWYGNQTIWRMILDLNKILFYANPDGTVREEQAHNRKRYISVVDGIIAGEGNGPEAPEPKHTGLLLAGTNPVAVDAACVKFMGFDWQKIPSIYNAFAIQRLRLCDFCHEDIRLVSSHDEWRKSLADIPSSQVAHFTPHFGWKGHIELVR